MIRYYKALLLLVPVLGGTPSRRNVGQLSAWAHDQGCVLHQSLQWKQYDEGDDWGLELKEPVPRGTVLLQVPRDLVLDARCIHDELVVRDDGEGKLERALQALGEFGIHKDGFLIFCKLLRCCKDEGSSKWAPWIQAMPQTFPHMSSAEKDCLPMYAKYAADYQDKKFQAFCRAAAEIDGEWKEGDPTLRWAFDAVGSRFWKTVEKDSEHSNSELVPVGDMFNHREPPNVAVVHEGGFVNFIYKGDADENNKDLYITYGQPSIPHRFLAIFGFVPREDGMPEVWSHLSYPDNPFSVDASKMVFRVADGFVPKSVWDAVLYALLQPPAGTPTPTYTTAQHAKYKKFTLQVLQTHVANQLQTLALLRQKIDALDERNENIELLRQHNELLTNVFSRVQGYLEDDTLHVHDR